MENKFLNLNYQVVEVALSEIERNYVAIAAALLPAAYVITLCNHRNGRRVSSSGCAHIREPSGFARERTFAIEDAQEINQMEFHVCPGVIS